MSDAPKLKPVAISSGAGSFVFDQFPDGEHAPMSVHYYWPSTVVENARIVFVMHGLLRDGERYRDRWQHHAEEHGFLLIAPEFDREFYPADADYNLAGIVNDEANREFNTEEYWAFYRIELLFEVIQLSTPFTTECFGIYGHSAGAQFVHRLVLFHPEARFDVAVAANAGWYTLPCQETEFPYGVGNAPVPDSKLAQALRRRLVILLGEEDVDKAHHSLRRTPEALEQGTHRLERGRFFVETGRETAKRLGVEFGWRIETVRGAAHNDREMSAAAVRFLT